MRCYTLSGRYQVDVHGVGIDWLAVPAGLYFLWVVYALYRGTFRDWNGSPLRTRKHTDRARSRSSVDVTARYRGVSGCFGSRR